jgi:heptaprenyl diphosphate synthase
VSLAVNGSDLFALPVAEADLARLEECLRASVRGDDPFLNEVATHLISAGGKRIRPALTLTAAELSRSDISDESILGGVSVELVHLASLYHDDVMDEAVRRRSVESVNARWGNLVAIVAGDFLLARSAEIAASLGPEIASLLASTLARLCQGQVAEVRSAYQVSRDEKDYLGAISNKTAALMSTACRIGGLTSRLSRPGVENLTAFGESFGMLFQIRDDVLDVIASEEELGKPPGQDLAEGVYTLPVQRALSDLRVGQHLSGMLGHPLGPDERERARQLVAGSEGIAEAALVARQYAEEATAAARRLDEGPVSERLARLANDVACDLCQAAEGARSRFEEMAG